MKTSSIILLLLLSGFSYGKQLPSPFWYNLSKKILVETQRLITVKEEPQTPTTRKVATKSTKVVKAPLKCQQTKEARLQTPLSPKVKDTFQEI
jgi:hypothetical protein